MIQMIVTREEYMDLIEQGMSNTRLSASARARLRAHALSATAVRIGSYLSAPYCPARQVGLFDAERGFVGEDGYETAIFAAAFDRAAKNLWESDQGRDLPNSLPTDLVIA